VAAPWPWVLNCPVVSATLPQPGTIKVTLPQPAPTEVRWPRIRVTGEPPPPPPRVIHLGSVAAGRPFRVPLPGGHPLRNLFDPPPGAQTRS
jgi:hypothetical protein